MPCGRVGPGARGPPNPMFWGETLFLACRARACVLEGGVSLFTRQQSSKWSPVSPAAQPTRQLPPQGPTNRVSPACSQFGVRAQNRSAGASSPNCPGLQCHRRGHRGTDRRGTAASGGALAVGLRASLTTQRHPQPSSHSGCGTATSSGRPRTRTCRHRRTGSCVPRLSRGLWMNQPNASEHALPPEGSEPLGPNPTVSQAALRHDGGDVP